jgi:hypothetical protein
MRRVPTLERSGTGRWRLEGIRRCTDNATDRQRFGVNGSALLIEPDETVSNADLQTADAAGGCMTLGQ